MVSVALFSIIIGHQVTDCVDELAELIGHRKKFHHLLLLSFIAVENSILDGFREVT